MRTVRFEVELIHVESMMDIPGYDIEKYGVTDETHYISEITNEFHDVELTDEQYDLLLDYESNIDKDECIADINEDFKRICDGLTKPMFAKIEQLYREYGYTDEVIKEEMHWIGANIRPLLENNLRNQDDVVEYIFENGLYIHVLRNGMKRIEACTDKDIEVLDSDAQYIAPRAFAGCRKLRKVNLPNAILIDECAFVCCTSLRTVELSPNIRCIRWGAFSDCYFLHDIDLSEGVMFIEDLAFYDCIHLNPDIKLPLHNVDIGKNAFAYTPLQRFSYNTEADEDE